MGPDKSQEISGTPAKVEGGFSKILGLARGVFRRSTLAQPQSEPDNQEPSWVKALVSNNALPAEILGEDSRIALELAGVKFGDVFPDDRLFRSVQLPEGWKLMSTQAYKVAKLVDGEGRQRAEIHYDPKYYDRDAYMIASPRFGVRIDKDRLAKQGVIVAEVTDGGIKNLYTTEPIKVKDRQITDKESRTALGKARAWLGERYPYWPDPEKYWNDSPVEALSK